MTTTIRRLHEKTAEELMKIVKASEPTAKYKKATAEDGENAILELARRIDVKNARKKVEDFTSVKNVAEYLIPLIGHLEVEHFVVLILNTKNKGIATLVKKDNELKKLDDDEIYDEFFQQNKVYKYIDEDFISKGTVDQTFALPSDVFRKAIELNAVSIIVAHNHPSGDVTPSGDDIRMTQRLAECGELLGIKVLDSFVIGKDNYYSLKQHNDF